MAGATLTPQAIADLVGGRLRGAGELEIRGVAPLDRAGSSDLSFLTSARYVGDFLASAAGAVLLGRDFEDVTGGPEVRIVVPDPASAMASVMAVLYPDEQGPPGVHPTARLGPGVVLGSGVSVGAMAVLGPGVRLGDRVVVGPGAVLEAGVTIGDETVVGPRVVCEPGTRIGRRCRIKAGAVLGGIGFGYVSTRDGHRRVPHVGRCVIEDDVDIGANTCIDRGSLGDTIVGAGTRIDNLVHLAHNVRVGRRCLLMAQVAVAGSTRLGDGVVLAGQVGVADHLRIGDGARLSAQSGVTGDVPPGVDYGGWPARRHREWLRSTAVLYGLAPIARDLHALVRERKAHG